MKRITGLVLAFVIVFGCMSAFSFSATAVSDFTTSEACVELIKYEEGFVKYPMYDYGQYSVGYGTRCPADKYEEYCQNGIPEEEAEALLRLFLRDFEADINHDLIDRYGLTMTQNQFDALVMFSYNCGTGWI